MPTASSLLGSLGASLCLASTLSFAVGCATAPNAVFADDAAFAASLAPRALPPLGGDPGAAAISADGRWYLHAESLVLPARGTLLKLFEIVADDARLELRPRAEIAVRAVNRLEVEAPIVLSGDGSVAMTWHFDGMLRFWSLRPDASPPIELVGEMPITATVTSLALADDGTLALCGDKGGDVAVWRIARAGASPSVTPVGTFHASGDRIDALAIASTHAGDLLVLTAARGVLRPSLWRVPLPSGEARVGSQGAPETATGAASKATPSPSLLVATEIPIAAELAPPDQIRVSRDGRLVAIGSAFSGTLYAIDARGLTRLGDLASVEEAAFSADGTALLSRESGRANVWNVRAVPPERVASMPVERRVIAAGFAARHALVVERRGVLRSLPASAWPAQSVVIGAEPIVWQPPPIAGAPWSELTATLAPAMAATTAAERRIELRIRNTGPGAAYEVRASLAITDPHHPPATAATLFFGTIAPGATVVRTLPPLPSQDELYVDVRVTRADEPPIAPLAWHRLPQHDHTAEDIDRHAARVFVAARDVMRELLGDASFSPTLERRDPELVGFSTHGDQASGAIVRYQNAYAMIARGLVLNREVIRPASRADQLAEMELMLDVYLPHEMAHAARMHTGTHVDHPWREELAANLIQAAAMERVLAKQPSTPYTFETMRRVFDRYVARLGPLVSAEMKAQTERMIATDGRDHPSTEPSTLFGDDVPAYVYIGARIAQYALQTGVTLDALRARYLTPAVAPASP